MKPDEANDLKDVTTEDMTIEQRIKALSKYYEKDNPFTEEEIISDNDLKGAYGRTLLHDAVLREDLEEIEKLIKEGASTIVKDNTNCTPYQLAVIEGKTKAVKKLKKLGITT
jgi:ankyrin repeat protein